MTPGEGQTDARSLGWLASLGLHAALAFGTLILTQRITLAPQPPAFTWRVAMVAAPSDSPQPSNSASTPVHAPLRSAPEMPTVRDSTPRAAAASSAENDAAAGSTANDPTLQENRMRSQPLSGDDMASPQPPAASSIQSPVETARATG
jgi:hypothetical protein